MSGPSNVTSNAVEALHRAEEKLQRAAERIAKLPLSTATATDEINLSEEFVNLIHARNSYEANLRAIRMIDETQQHVIDILG
ncbi:MAG: hypothetical protein GY953_13180 [bacterium]|nr:hypothetical protein [bacterium]